MACIVDCNSLASGHLESLMVSNLLKRFHVIASHEPYSNPFSLSIALIFDIISTTLFFWFSLLRHVFAHNIVSISLKIFLISWSSWTSTVPNILVRAKLLSNNFVIYDLISALPISVLFLRRVSNVLYVSKITAGTSHFDCKNWTNTCPASKTVCNCTSLSVGVSCFSLLISFVNFSWGLYGCNASAVVNGWYIGLLNLDPI